VKLKKVIILNIYPNTMFVHLVMLCIITLWELFFGILLKGFSFKEPEASLYLAAFAAAKCDEKHTKQSTQKKEAK